MVAHFCGPTTAPLGLLAARRLVLVAPNKLPDRALRGRHHPHWGAGFEDPAARRGEGKTTGCVEDPRQHPRAYLVVGSAREVARVRQQYTTNEHHVSKRIVSYDTVMEPGWYVLTRPSGLVIDNADLISWGASSRCRSRPWPSRGRTRCGGDQARAHTVARAAWSDPTRTWAGGWIIRIKPWYAGYTVMVLFGEADDYRCIRG